MPRDNGKSDTNRRRFLKSTGGVALVSALAGCPSGGQGTGTDAGTDAGGDTATPTDTPTPTQTPEPKTSTQAGGPPKGGTFTIGLPEPPKGINILASNSAYSAAIYDMVYEAGVSVDPVNFEIHPNLYTDWTVRNVDSGQPDVFFNVRTDAGLQWSDGETFDMQDVLFTHSFLLDQNPGNYASTLKPIKTVEKASNEWDVHMKLNKPIGTWDSSQLALPILPQHIWSQVDDYQKYQPGNMISDGRPVGLGIGKVTQYQPDTAIEVKLRDAQEQANGMAPYKLSDLQWLKDHQNMLAGGPFLDTVRYKVYSSETALNQALFEGDIDSIYASIDSSKIEQAKKNERIGIVQGTDTGFGYVAWNLRRMPFDDLVFRQMMGFLWDDVYWIRRLNQNNALKGDFVMPPGYTQVRPESASEDVEMLTDPATEAFDFRQSAPGVPNFSGIRKFLTNGEPITGEGGTYVGQEYPGSITGVKSSQTEGKHDYTFGPVKSSILKEAGATKEIRVNGKTIPEIKGGPIEYHSYPPASVPELTKMDQQYVQNLKQLGIPVKRQVISFNSLLTDVFAKEDFDITHLGWTSMSQFGTSSLYAIWHSDNADDLTKVEEGDEKKNTQTQHLNQVGYGLFEDASADELISEARTTMETQKRNQLTRKAVERVYLDMPYMVFDYDKISWPVDQQKFTGFIEGIPSPGGTWLTTNIMNMHLNE